MQDSSWHDLVEAVWSEKKDTVDFLRDEKRRTEIVSAANRNGNGRLALAVSKR